MIDKKIIFSNVSDVPLEQPKPASKFIPDWYKEHDSYVTEGSKKVPMPGSRTVGTIKKCIPVFDVLSLGYIITTATDIYVKQTIVDNKKVPNFIYSNLNYVTSQNKKQAETKRRNAIDHYIPKITNVWGIKTPPGYSCLFIPPMHRDNILEILPGVVDTDMYNTPVEFPFMMSDVNFEGLIPEGTPIVQVIPFKRDNWKSSVQENKKEMIKQNSKLYLHFFDSYKKMFWNKKKYS